jgi:hypothetical protein
VQIGGHAKGSENGWTRGITSCDDPTVSGYDDVTGEPDGETGGDDGVGCVGQVICIYPYVPIPHHCVERRLWHKPVLEN